MTRTVTISVDIETDEQLADVIETMLRPLTAVSMRGMEIRLCVYHDLGEEDE